MPKTENRTFFHLSIFEILRGGITKWLEGLFDASFWSKSITRHRSIPLLYKISQENGLDIIRDHDLLARLFFPSDGFRPIPPIKNIPGVSTYKVRGPGDLETKFEFETTEGGTISRQSVGPGVDLIMSWQVEPSGISQDDPYGTGYGDKIGQGGLSLHERVEVKCFMPLAHILSLRIGDTISDRARSIAKAIELRSIHPTISTEQLVHEVKTYIREFDLLYRGKDENPIDQKGIS